MKKWQLSTIVLLVIFALWWSLSALGASSVRVETRQLKSEMLKRTVSYDVILPSGYDDNNWRYPVLYLLQGLGGHYDSWVIATNVATYAAQHKLIIVTPESADGWWTDSYTDKNDQYESYFMGEMLPLIDKNYRTLPFQKYRGVAGLSMGGYGALKFGVKYPDKFAFAGSLSGALDAAEQLERPGYIPWAPAMWSFCKPSLMAVFGPAGSKTRADNDLFALYAKATVAGMPYIYSDCGTEDPFFSTNVKLATLLRERGIAHTFLIAPGNHDWYYWDEHIQYVLQLAEKRL